MSLHVMLDLGAIVQDSDGSSCREARRRINRYADHHRRRLDTFLTLEQTTSRRQLERFQARHEGEVRAVIGAAMELDQRCAGDEKLERALRRVGFQLPTAG